MSLLTIDPVSYEVKIEAEAIQLAPFRALYKKDKTRDKRGFKNELSFIYFYSNAKSDYMYLTDLKERAGQIMRDLKMIQDGEEAKISSQLSDAIDFYATFRTITEELYFGASRAAGFVNDKLKNADKLLDKVDERSGKPIYSLKDIMAAVKEVPATMRNLKAALKEVVLEQVDTAGKKKGSKEFNMFEDGIDIDEE